MKFPLFLPISHFGHLLSYILYICGSYFSAIFFEFLVFSLFLIYGLVMPLVTVLATIAFFCFGDFVDGFSLMLLFSSLYLMIRILG